MKKNSPLGWSAVLEIFLLALGAGFLFFSIYILPRVLFHIDYEVPNFLIWLEYWSEKHNHHFDAFLYIFLPLFLMGIICFYLARSLNRKLENNTSNESRSNVYHESPAEAFFNRPHSLRKLILILVLSIGLFFLLINSLDWFFMTYIATGT